MSSSSSRKRERLLELENECRAVGRLLKEGLPPECGFFLAMFDFGPSGWSTYVSNGERADMVKCLRELAEHLETGRGAVDTSAGGSSEPGGDR